MVRSSHGETLLGQFDRAEVSAQRPPRSRLRIGIAVTGLMVYAAVVLAATLSPTPLDQGYGSSIQRFLDVLHRNGVPEWFGYSKLEFFANVLMFLPFGFLMTLALPRRGVWAVILAVPAFSGAIELFQATFLAARFASVFDVLANTAGGYAGAIVAIALRAVIHARDEKLIARALWDRGLR